MRTLIFLGLLVGVFLKGIVSQVPDLPARSKSLPFITKRERFTRKELTQLWKDMKPDPDAEETTVTKKAMGRAKHVFNGKDSYRGQFPYQAGILLDHQFFCGGSLITNTHILSAAHCVEGIKTFTVSLGAYARNTEEDGRKTFETTKAVMHPRYDTNLVKNDIAIITLPYSAQLTDFIQLIRLPKKVSSTRMLVKLVGTVSGWGKTETSGKNVSTHLMHTALRIIPNIECVRLYGKESVLRSNLCVKGKEHINQGTCNGDSGGPFVIKEKDNEWTQVGIVSYGAASGCGLGYPDVMTRVVYYATWIERNSNARFRE